jgi:hypothetical protein
MRVSPRAPSPHANRTPRSSASPAVDRRDAPRPIAAALVLTLFAWPQARMEPRDLPIGVAGPSAATQMVEHTLTA